MTTAGNGTLLAAALLGGIITRSGPGGAFTDTTDTAAAIAGSLTGMSNVNGTVTFTCQYLNTSGSTATLAAGANVTLTANTGAGLTVNTNTSAILLFSVNPAAGTVTILVVRRNTDV